MLHFVYFVQPLFARIKRNDEVLLLIFRAGHAGCSQVTGLAMTLTPASILMQIRVTGACIIDITPKFLARKVIITKR
jgi:hypothetical protein